jgi:hypothetical protein
VAPTVQLSYECSSSMEKDNGKKAATHVVDSGRSIKTISTAIDSPSGSDIARRRASKLLPQGAVQYSVGGGLPTLREGAISARRSEPNINTANLNSSVQYIRHEVSRWVKGDANVVDDDKWRVTR